MEKHVLVLRTCSKDMTSSGGFKWPTSGDVSAPDWEPSNSCGKGLHGFLWGAGDGTLANWDSDAKWLVVKVSKDSIIDLCGKVKFPAGEVVYCGDRQSATQFLRDNGSTAAITMVSNPQERRLKTGLNLSGGIFHSEIRR